MVPPTEPCALNSTQPLKVSTRDFSWDKGGRCVWLTACHPCSAETSRKSGALIYPEPLGPPRPVAGDLYFYFLCMYIYIYIYIYTTSQTTGVRDPTKARIFYLYSHVREVSAASGYLALFKERVKQYKGEVYF